MTSGWRIERWLDGEWEAYARTESELTAKATLAELREATGSRADWRAVRVQVNEWVLDW